MIGERLEEARKRKGLSIREVAEATKIRGDFLLAMEDNSFGIPLPEIYIRGFLKNYARFLNLDTNKVLTDYDAHLLGRATHAAGAGTGSSSRNSLGRMEIQHKEGTPGTGDVPEHRLPACLHARRRARTSLRRSRLSRRCLARATSRRPPRAS